MIKQDKLKRMVLLSAFLVSVGTMAYASNSSYSIQSEEIASSAVSNQQVSASSKHVMFGVHGTCGMCKERIEKAAKSVPGVKIAQWDQAKQMIHLQIDTKKTSVDVVAKAIAKVGHDTDKYKADKKAYSELPECCQYRK